MVWYTYGTVPVYDPTTDRVIENATGGKFRLVPDGADQPMRDLNATPITSITSNGSGQSSIFQAESLYGVVQFGTVAVTVWANEVADKLNTVDATLTSTIALLAQVQAAQTAIGTGLSVDWTAGVTNKPTTFPPSAHTHPASQISDSTTVGRSVLSAVDAQAARSAIGAGTGNGTSTLALGVTSTTAAAGNHAHAATAITFTPTGSITATDVQTAIVQAAASTGGSGSGTADDLEWIYASGAYPTLPTTQPTGLKVVYAEGPVWPSTLPTWITSGAVRLRYKYAA